MTVMDYQLHALHVSTFTGSVSLFKSDSVSQCLTRLRIEFNDIHTIFPFRQVNPNSNLLTVTKTGRRSASGLCRNVRHQTPESRVQF